MKAPEEPRTATLAQPAATDLTFAAGSFEFAHWLSNIGDGPQTMYAGAYAVMHNDTRHLAYSLNLRNTLDSERDYVRSALDDVVQVSQPVVAVARLGFPSASLGELATSAGVTNLRRDEAIAATQATIWSLTGDFLFAGLLEAGFTATARVLKVMSYLLDAADSSLANNGDAGRILGLVRADQTASEVHSLILSGADTSDVTSFGFSQPAGDYDLLDEAC